MDDHYCRWTGAPGQTSHNCMQKHNECNVGCIVSTLTAYYSVLPSAVLIIEPAEAKAVSYHLFNQIIAQKISCCKPLLYSDNSNSLSVVELIQLLSIRSPKSRTIRKATSDYIMATYLASSPFR